MGLGFENMPETQQINNEKNVKENVILNYNFLLRKSNNNFINL